MEFAIYSDFLMYDETNMTYKTSKLFLIFPKYYNSGYYFNDKTDISSKC